MLSKTCPKCHTQIPREKYAFHLQQDHGFKECPFCDDMYAIDLMRQHILDSHNQTEQCPVCPSSHTQDGLTDHLLEKHSCARCRFFNEAVSAGALSEHTRQRHDPKPCPRCEEIYPTSTLTAHQKEAHSYRQCSFCPYLAEEVADHIFTVHRDLCAEKELPRNHQVPPETELEGRDGNWRNTQLTSAIETIVENMNYIPSRDLSMFLSALSEAMRN
ncbi:hypothetical protein HD806DRAFT_396443 [Xylariaceae sp. AK1471]|nr:hypothetical protein HD806DRAFT_396443 [Xylariaceae sp. AK1471]